MNNTREAFATALAALLLVGVGLGVYSHEQAQQASDALGIATLDQAATQVAAFDATATLWATLFTPAPTLPPTSTPRATWTTVPLATTPPLHPIFQTATWAAGLPSPTQQAAPLPSPDRVVRNPIAYEVTAAAGLRAYACEPLDAVNLRCSAVQPGVNARQRGEVLGGCGFHQGWLRVEIDADGRRVWVAWRNAAGSQEFLQITRAGQDWREAFYRQACAGL